MNRPLKLILSILGGLVGIVLVLVVAIVILVDPNDFRSEIEAAVEDATGRELTIEGDLHLSIFPWLGIELGRTQLADAEGFGDQPMLSVESVQLRLKLIPLLSKRFDADRIVLEGLDLKLRRDAEGRNNWDDLTAQDEDGASSDSSLGEFDLGGIRISDAQVLWDDAQAGQMLRISDLDLDTGRIRAGEPVDLDLTVSFENSGPAIAGTLGLHGEVTVTADMGRVSVPDLRVDLTASGAGLGAARAVTLQLTAEDLIADLNAERHSAVSVITHLHAEGDELPGGSVDADVTLSALEADLRQDTLRITEVVLQALGLRITADLQGDGISAEPALAGRMRIDRFSPRDLLGKLGQSIETADAALLGSAELSARYNLGSNSLNLDELHLMLDDTTVTGSFGIADLTRQAIRFQLAVDTIDADRYLPPVAETTTEESGGAMDDMPLPTDAIRGLDMDGSLTIGQLTIMGTHSSDVAVSLRAAGDALEVTQMRAQLYQGSMQGSARVDASREVPTLRIREELRGVRIHSLLSDFAEIEDISGLTDLRVDLAGEGATVGALKRSLDGTVGVSMTDVTLDGFDLWYEIRSASAQIPGVDAGDPGTDRGMTRITNLSMSATGTDGVFRSEDLNARLPYLNLTGAGTVDLGTSLVDYALQVLVLRNPELEGDALAAALYDVPVPVTFRGPYDDFEQMRIRPDIEAVIAAKARQRIEEEGEGLLEKAKQRLRDIFGRDG